MYNPYASFFLGMMSVFVFLTQESLPGHVSEEPKPDSQEAKNLPRDSVHKTRLP